MRFKREISSFDSTEKNILEDQSGLEEEMKLEGDNESYSTSDESFSRLDMDLETMENKNENSRAQRLIWQDRRVFNLETKPETKRGENQQKSCKRRRAQRMQTKQVQVYKDANLVETKDEWEDKSLPEIEDERAYLWLVNAEDCIKDLVAGLYSLQLQHSIANRMARQKKIVKPLMINQMLGW